MSKGTARRSPTSSPSQLKRRTAIPIFEVDMKTHSKKAKKYSYIKDCKKQPREICDQCNKKSSKPVCVVQDRLTCTYGPEETCKDEKKQYGHKVEEDVLEEVCKWHKSTKNNGHEPKGVVCSKKSTQNCYILSWRASKNKLTNNSEEISAMVLTGKKEIAETFFGKKTTHKTTKDAGPIAHSKVKRIIKEPIAAAIAYCADEEEGKKEVHAVQKLRREVEKVKRSLSYAHQVRMEVKSRFEEVESMFKEEEFSETPTRAKFEEQNKDLFKGTLEPIQQVREDAEGN